MNNDYSARFGGTQRLYTSHGQKLLKDAHVAIVGIGGVGSWTVESLVRSGVGKITLMDMDDVCYTNIGRQIHALSSTAGKFKVQVMKERILDISPECKVNAIEEFFSESTKELFFQTPYDFVIDAIDSVNNKALLIAECFNKNIPIITCGGAAGKVDPSKVLIADLNRTKNDPLLARMRKILRKKHNFEQFKGRKYGIPCVFSTELSRYYHEDTICDRPSGPESARINCHQGMGTSSFITGTFGFFQAAHVLNCIVDSMQEQSRSENA
jgi:tRNA A37 threonylcarbamoyladenosine dehydratase